MPIIWRELLVNFVPKFFTLTLVFILKKINNLDCSFILPQVLHLFPGETYSLLEVVSFFFEVLYAVVLLVSELGVTFGAVEEESFAVLLPMLFNSFLCHVLRLENLSLVLALHIVLGFLSCSNSSLFATDVLLTTRFTSTVFLAILDATGVYAASFRALLTFHVGGLSSTFVLNIT